MTTQKVVSVLSNAGFKAFQTEWVTEKISDSKISKKQVRKGDYSVNKSRFGILVETFGKKTTEMVAALNAAGIKAVDYGNTGIIKI